ncbi:MAG: hypothetical protein H7A51_06665 [Akkermansiaceae bacterium]|nr:hypothetical protein [Akkermansiaceae bacterium]
MLKNLVENQPHFMTTDKEKGSEKGPKKKKKGSKKGSAKEMMHFMEPLLLS